MTPELAEQLHPPRLPEAFAALGLGDVLACLGLGLLLAALVLTVAGPLMARRPRPVGVKERLAAAAALPEGERLLALARLAAERGRPLPADLSAALYTPDTAAPERFEAHIRGARRQG